jgi:cation diffusion facilitator family transporter|tara:strand:+ start:4616 stop:5497 length:882 start_codon:yes stop_codon:yes gene_type:complete
MTIDSGSSQINSRDSKVQRILLIEGSVNLLVFVAKLIVGLTTGSLAILGDAIHSMTDVINNVIAWSVVRLSHAPADREHPYGHRKFETLAVFFLASLLVVLAFELALRAITAEQKIIEDSNWALGVMLGVLCVNVALTIWQRRWANRLQSDILKADASHTLADVLTTVVVIVGWQLSAAGYLWLDRLCALAVASLILFLAFKLFQSAAPVLVDEFALDPEILTESIEDVPGIRQVSRVRSRWIGSEKAVDLVIGVDAGLSFEDSHQIATDVELHLERKFGIADISIHVEPYNK